MVSWLEFAADAPEFASRVEQLFAAHKHHTMATVRRDGAPRISGTEIEFADGDLCFGMMAGARRGVDLQRDPRLALHSHSVDPPEGDPSAWSGEAKVGGRAGRVEGDGSGAHYRVDIIEVVLTRVGTPADHLDVEWWTPARGLTVIRR
jgi:hypothetical protein